MPPRKSGDRKQPARKIQKNVSFVSDDLIARRVKRYLDDLERVNYTRTSFDADEAAADKERLAVSEGKRNRTGKRSTMGVRQILLYRKNLNTLIDESGIKNLPDGTPTYLSASAPAPSEPPLRFCVGCGYWGKYRCDKCGDDICSIKCNDWHKEYRCGKL